MHNLYIFAMSQKLPLDGFKWEKDKLRFDEGFIGNHDENNDKGYIPEVYATYPLKLQELHNNLLLLSDKMKTQNFGKVVCNL